MLSLIPVAEYLVLFAEFVRAIAKILTIVSEKINEIGPIKVANKTKQKVKTREKKVSN